MTTGFFFGVTENDEIIDVSEYGEVPDRSHEEKSSFSHFREDTRRRRKAEAQTSEFVEDPSPANPQELPQSAPDRNGKICLR